MASKVLYILFALEAIIFIPEVATVECNPKLCDYVQCERSESLCQYPGARRIKNGGLCGCCDKCYILKRKGQSCFVILQKFGKMDVRCEPGTICKLMSLKCE